jgi:hypothetical protein
MDPLVEALQRRVLQPGDHSLDGLPVTMFVVGLVLIVGTTLALRLTGRSYRKWHMPALCVFFAWWAGVNMGHSGFLRGGALLWTFALPLILADPFVRTLRAALVPVDPDARR